MKPLGDLKIGDWFYLNASLHILTSNLPPSLVRAVRFSPQGGYLQVCVYHQDDEVQSIGKNLRDMIRLENAA